jgi:hypothetical protein
MLGGPHFAGGHPQQQQQQAHHVAYLPPNLPPLYGSSSNGGPPTYTTSVAYPPGSPGQPQQQQQQQQQQATYVIAGYPPGNNQPPVNAQYFAVPSTSFVGSSGAYPGPPPQPQPHGSSHPHQQHHPHQHHQQHHSPQQQHGGPPVYVRHGLPPGEAQPRGAATYTTANGALVYAHHAHPSAVSASTHASSLSGKQQQQAMLLDKEPPAGSHHETKTTPTGEPLPSMEEIQAAREREEQAMELMLKSVKPIQTDYHLFIQEEMPKLEKVATADGGEDAYLRNSSLNYRLKAAWEHLDPGKRAIYFKREEIDRQRFTEEEEVACRHCATLTARNTPIFRKKAVDEAEEGRDETNKRAREEEEADPHADAIKKERLAEEAPTQVADV